MTEEEKKAIEILKDRERDFDELYSTFRQSFIKPYDKAIDKVLKLIDNQQKEIEELKNYEKYYEEMEEVNKKFIAVDKIKEKIQYWQKERHIAGEHLVVEVLKSLLKEK